MKKMTKMLLAAGGAALICGGSVVNYLLAQRPVELQEELTLSNIETLGKGGSVDNQGGCSGLEGNCYAGKCGICKTPLGSHGPGSYSGSHSCRVW